MVIISLEIIGLRLGLPEGFKIKVDDVRCQFGLETGTN